MQHTHLTYLVAMKEGSLHVLSLASGYTLPGGDTKGASPEAYLLGVCLSHTGYDVEVEDLILSEEQDGRTVDFYSGRFVERLTDDGAEPILLPLESIDKLTDPLHRRAALECADMLRSDAHGSDDEDL